METPDSPKPKSKIVESISPGKYVVFVADMSLRPENRITSKDLGQDANEFFVSATSFRDVFSRGTTFPGVKTVGWILRNGEPERIREIIDGTSKIFPKAQYLELMHEKSITNIENIIPVYLGCLGKVIGVHTVSVDCWPNINKSMLCTLTKYMMAYDHLVFKDVPSGSA